MHAGMKLVCVKHFPEAKFSLYFLAQRLPEGETAPSDPEAEASWGIMKRMHDPVLELTHNHGTEADAAFSYHNGNTEPRGFGHTGFLCDDLEVGAMRGIGFNGSLPSFVRPDDAPTHPPPTPHHTTPHPTTTRTRQGACAMLEAAGVAFQKKPQDGSMRGLAFALDPDGKRLAEPSPAAARTETGWLHVHTHTFMMVNTHIHDGDTERSQSPIRPPPPPHTHDNRQATGSSSWAGDSPSN